MRTQLLIFLVIGPLTGKIEVEIGEDRRKSVWIVSLQVASAGKVEVQAIGCRRDGLFVAQTGDAKGKDRFKHSIRVDALGGIDRPVLSPDDIYAISSGAKGSDCECRAAGPADLMRTQKAKRVGILGAHEAQQVFSV